ncbi:MAG: DUF3833 domain-containing protein [Pseudomonadota bacterium]
MSKGKTAALVGVLLLAGCGGMKPQDFAGKEPRFQLESYFVGKSKAWGIFQDRFGTLKRQLEVDLEGTWDGDTLVLVEDFRYDDGEEEQRVWTIQKDGEHGYSGTAPGVIGTAEGQAYGNAFNWTYDFALPVGESTWNVTFDDWMFLQSDGVLINRAEVKKFGIEIGTLTLTFKKMN